MSIEQQRELIQRWKRMEAVRRDLDKVRSALHDQTRDLEEAYADNDFDAVAKHTLLVEALEASATHLEQRLQTLTDEWDELYHEEVVEVSWEQVRADLADIVLHRRAHAVLLLGRMFRVVRRLAEENQVLPDCVLRLLSYMLYENPIELPEDPAVRAVFAGIDPDEVDDKRLYELHNAVVEHAGPVGDGRHGWRNIARPLLGGLDCEVALEVAARKLTNEEEVRDRLSGEIRQQRKQELAAREALLTED